ncbi:glycosyltransferase family 4 protein [Paradesulfitobacterium ferrireducens]|uniref:glycosyltransferase family 4 protein n=1 Tax=Paradesulfitobacterium ferrireducens TaxID=2816476 RepID=UPI001A8C8D90|nr:glycosyltransferase family 4 protein [Paradesulfitobacterium ferrireducens]
MRYCVLFPEAQNVHLVKDVGMIPYKLKQLGNYQAVLATYDNGPYPYLEDVVPGLELDFIGKRGDVSRTWRHSAWDGVHYLRRKGKEIDILQVFHMTLSSIVYAYSYKRVNPGGIIFLKLDCSIKLVEKLRGLGRLPMKLLHQFLERVDLIGVEQEKLQQDITEIFPAHRAKIIYLPNGVDFADLERYRPELQDAGKENLILTVARIGSEEKNTPMLLQAFARLVQRGKREWKLVLVGAVASEFQRYLDRFWEQNPELKEYILFRGELASRRELWTEYSRAKIFCLTSNYESFGFALIEAAAAGAVIISTDVGIASELVREGNGAVVPVKDVDALTDKLAEFMERPDLTELCGRSARICREKFNWDEICVKLDRELRKRIMRS